MSRISSQFELFRRGLVDGGDWGLIAWTDNSPRGSAQIKRPVSRNL